MTKINQKGLSYRTILQELLVNAGVLGMSQQKITLTMRNTATSEMLKEELHRLHKLGHVQKFVIPSKKGGPHQTVWRGTTTLTVYLLGGSASIDEMDMGPSTYEAL